MGMEVADGCERWEGGQLLEGAARPPDPDHSGDPDSVWLHDDGNDGMKGRAADLYTSKIPIKSI